MADDPITWLYGLQKHGVKLGLGGIRTLLDGLGNPDRAYPSILVGGTNGKGSVAAMLDAILAAAGVGSGLYTSPHLIRPNERFRIRGIDIADADLGRLIDRVRALCEAGVAGGSLGAHPSFFEVATAVALEAFREARVDAAVLEVGLGGRLDATNAVEPLVSVVVTVDFDHMAQLGSTLGKIAGEKAGIVRPGRPLVTGVTEQEPLAVLRARCREAGADLIEAHALTRIEPCADGRLTIVTSRRRYDDLATPLDGEHQIDNARVAIVAFERLAAAIGLPVDPGAVRAGLGAVRWPGRLQWIEGTPPVLLDGAHNASGAEALARWLDARGGARPVLIFGAMKDKELEAILHPLATRSSAVVTTAPSVDRAAEPESLAALAAPWTRHVEAAGSIRGALDRARVLAAEHADAYVLVAGSLYLVGEALSVLEGTVGPGPIAM